MGDTGPYLDCVKNRKKVNVINDLWESRVRKKSL
jgi:hypothetical protein